MAPFDIYQQTFLLSFVAEILKDTKAPLAQLQYDAQNLMPQAIGSYGIGPWNIVWGPTVWKHTHVDDSHTGPDNTWFIARHTYENFPDGTHDNYVLGIAGSASSYDYLHDDFGVDKVVDFDTFAQFYILPPIVTSGDKVMNNSRSYLSWGAASATYTLLNTPSPTGAAGAGTTIVQFLSTASPSSKIVITGHSLGGALAPSLAMVLERATQWKNMLVYPTAGPTPGNGRFATLFNSSFPAMSTGRGKIWQSWNINICNANDIVPLAWCEDPTSYLNLSRITSIYQGAPPHIHDALKAVGDTATVLANLSKISYTPIQNSIFISGDFLLPTSLSDLGIMVGVQHHDAYFAQVVPWIAPAADPEAPYELESVTVLKGTGRRSAFLRIHQDL